MIESDWNSDDLVRDAGLAFGLGNLVEYSLVVKPSLHTVYRCYFETGWYALKKIRKRPDLSGWRERFESAFTIEQWLSERYSFLPSPLSSNEGHAIAEIPAISNLECNEWFIAHSWMQGVPGDSVGIEKGLIESLVQIIGNVATVPVEILTDREGMDDCIPDASELLSKVLDLEGSTDLSNLSRVDVSWYADNLNEILSLSDPSSEVIVGHRDISPQNTLKQSSGSPAVIDWENAGPSCIESEVGRLIVHWCLTKKGVSSACLCQLMSCLVTLNLMEDKMSANWFKSWLSGHTMYLSYLIGKLSRNDTEPARRKIWYEANTLIRFVDHLPNMIKISNKVNNRVHSASA